tara:strand:+ start:168 stop:278 length:111 start_codon:yes stop_codon:yes gene_type:complete
MPLILGDAIVVGNKKNNEAINRFIFLTIFTSFPLGL